MIVVVTATDSVAHVGRSLTGVVDRDTLQVATRSEIAELDVPVDVPQDVRG